MKKSISLKPDRPSKPSRLYVIIPLTFLVVYAVFLVGRSIWQHYQINRQIDELTQNISDLKDKEKKYEQAIAYYNSVSFKEREAREKLGYQKKGETAIALPPKGDNQTSADTTEEAIGINTTTEFSQPNYVRWWNFFFKGE